MDVVRPLIDQAIKRFQTLAYKNIEVKVGDGYMGWPDNSPYDGIVIAAATPIVPLALVEQLKPGGIMVLPLGDPYRYQELITVKKSLQGEITTHNILPVSFVPMVDSSYGR
jgi:protein-L-isoaspartate(D-aspartate) O-methyltransferase